MARLLIVEDNPELASLVASVAGSRGHEAITAATGRAALEAIATRSADAAVVDLLLPDVAGSEVLSALREKAVPFVAVSGVFRGSSFATSATQTHGAKAFFEKPFDLEALFAEIERWVTASPPPAEPPTTESAVDVLLSLPPLTRDDWDRPWPEPARTRDLPTWARSGDLAATSVPRLLTAYYLARHEGELVLRQPMTSGSVAIKVVAFEEGLPVYAASNLARERFGRFCARRGVLREQDLDAVAALARESSLRTAEAMLQLGLITWEQRQSLLEEQVREIVWSTFAWTAGEFTFTQRRSRRDDLVKLRVFPGSLILQGVSKTEPLVALRTAMRGSRRMFPTADPPYELGALGLSPMQARLLAYSDGTKTVDDLVTLLCGDERSTFTERDVLAALRGFELAGLLEERQDDIKPRRVSFGL